MKNNKAATNSNLNTKWQDYVTRKYKQTRQKRLDDYRKELELKKLSKVDLEYEMKMRTINWNTAEVKRIREWIQETYPDKFKSKNRNRDIEQLVQLSEKIHQSMLDGARKQKRESKKKRKANFTFYSHVNDKKKFK